MGTVTAVVSGKGGTGKTTTVAVVASCLASRGHRTLCIDCDVGLKNLDINLGLSGLTNIDFNDVMSGEAALDDAVLEHPEIENLFFLSSPTTAEPEDIDPDGMKALLDEVREKFEYCFIDAPAGIGSGFRLAASFADAAIVVASGDALSMRDCQRAVSELGKLGIKNVRLVVNRVKPQFFAAMDATLDEMIDTVGARLLGVVEDDDTVSLALNSEIPLILCDSTKAMREFNRISLRIEGFDAPVRLK
ncbi:MAG: AAA family ATPase [Oscillospiraceae bacterium]|nr:AAA family ATPase [Oscillospiraceae bacterium]